MPNDPKLNKKAQSNEINDVSELNKVLTKVKKAQEEFATFSQEQVDKIFKAVAIAANKQRIPLAQLAVEETKMGIMEDKVLKNHFASELIYNKFKNLQTCGTLEDNESFGYARVLEPLGTIAAIIPTTNPTSTAIFKLLIALKTRNAMVISPHPRATKCTKEASRIVYEAAVKAGAPENIIAYITKPSKELSAELMKSSLISLVLATGGGAMVKAAYSSGNPAIGVGAGNAPVIIDSSADIKMAVASILLSKNFDHGVICATEQTAIVVEDIYEKVKEKFAENGAYICTKEEAKKLAKYFIIQEQKGKRGHLNADVVGQSAFNIAKNAGFSVGPYTKILIAEASEVGVDEAFCYEKLSPILALYKAKDYKNAVDLAKDILHFDGMGHTSSLYANEAEKEKIQTFHKEMPTGRILVNMPSSLGAIGDMYNFMLDPSLTLGCGSWGKNSYSGNITPEHLLNIKHVAKRRENMLWFRVPPKIYHKYGCLPIALKDIKDKERAVIVTDNDLVKLGYVERVTKVLDECNISYRIVSDVNPDPTFEEVRKGAELMRSFQPDVIISLGGGSPMDAAKIMRVLYEYPETNFEDISMRFMDIRKRIVSFPEKWKSIMVAIPTTSGTGAEVTPFSVISDENTGQKYPLADYALTPDMAIIDTELVMSMPKSLTAYSGFDAISHALESIASMLATPYTDSLALEALDILVRDLPIAYKEPNNQKARENVHNAATMAGMSFGNGFLGIAHSLSHKLGGYFHIPHGLCNALLTENVIRFNMVKNPRKQGVFPQYEYPSAFEKYVKAAKYLGLAGKTDEESIENLIAKINEVKKALGIDIAIKDCNGGISEKDFKAKLDKMSLDAFDDQCTGSNPRYPMVEEIKAIYLASFEGKPIKI